MLIPDGKFDVVTAPPEVPRDRDQAGEMPEGRADFQREQYSPHVDPMIMFARDAAMDQETRYSRNDDMLFGQSGSDTFMLNVPTGVYFALNETATRVWQILDQPRTEADIVSALVAEYRIDAGQCQVEIGPFLAELVKRNVLRTI